MKERHLNIKKVIIAVSIFVFSFVIIIVSALITSHSRTSKDEKRVDGSKQLSSASNDEDNKDKNSNKGNTNLENNGNSNDLNDSENGNTNSNSNNENVNSNTGENNNGNQGIHSQESNGVLPIFNPNAKDQIKSIYGSDEKQVYLTFDDGPSRKVTPQILQILKEENVPATFFLLGSRVELYPDLVKEEFESGHYIANHGYSHKYSSIYASVNNVIDEYQRTELAIQTALGNQEFHSYLFRFPGGSSGGPYHNLKQEAKDYLWNNGIASTNWNALNGDAEGGARSKEQLLNRLYETAEGHTSLIILMHDAEDKQSTADALREIIQNYKAQGYTFKNFYEIFR